MMTVFICDKISNGKVHEYSSHDVNRKGKGNIITQEAGARMFRNVNKIIRRIVYSP